MRKPIFTIISVWCIWGMLFACSSSSSKPRITDPAEPAFNQARFSNPTIVNNTYLPLVPGTTRTYQVETEDGIETIVVEVLEETRIVAGVSSVVVRDRVFLEEVLIEDTHDWFAQDDDGNVWYMGEEVINYEYDDDGNLIETNNEGAWEAGLDIAGAGKPAEAGIIMKATLTPGDTYRQEYYEGEAEDMGEIVALDVEITLSDGTTYSCLQTRDWTPLEPESEEYKYYAPGVGVVREEAIGGDDVFELKGTFLTLADNIPNFEAAVFTNSTVIDNTYLPLVPGTILTYEVETEDGIETIITEVLATTRTVNGVACVIFRDQVFLEGVLIEDTQDWFAQDDDGNVWYMGEEVINYEYDDDGALIETNNDGAWEAGVDGALPGVLMWAEPVLGSSYYQEYYEDEAEDMGMVVAMGVEVELEDGSIYENCLQILDWNPLEPETLEYKYYAPDVGLVKEEVLGGDETVELTSDDEGLENAKLLIEHNATDEDTGFQGFADGDPWGALSIKGPDGEDILTVMTEGNLEGFGLTELFFETSEPENDEVPIETVLARLDEGQYLFTGEMVNEDDSNATAPFSHTIPEGPELKSPVDGAANVDVNNTIISWNPVSKDLEGADLTIVGYQVIVEEDIEPIYPQGFARAECSIYLPATATRVTVPAEFMQEDTCYKYEVLTIEESGNQTISSAAFSTGSGCDEEEEDEDDTPKMTEAKLLIEHNATDEDTGFQGFGDGDPWNKLTISGPDNQSILSVTPKDGLVNFGLTELFFETSEPENDETPITEVLARLPEGTYTFTGDMVDGNQSTMTTTFSHKIPAGPELISPEDGAEEVDPNTVVISWEPVTEDLDGQSINIVGYQVIVEVDEEPEFPNGFAQPVFSVYLPASATRVTVPSIFMKSGESYEYEVLAIEESGNQTLSSAEFETQ